MYFEFCLGWEWGEWGRAKHLPPGRGVVVAVVRVYGKETERLGGEEWVPVLRYIMYVIAVNGGYTAV